MEIHEKYYLEAAREIEQIGRREDLWTKALALSGGEVSKAEALYIGLLARSLFDTSVSERKHEAIVYAKLIATNATRKTVIAFSIVFSWLLAASFFSVFMEEMSEAYADDLANNYTYGDSSLTRITSVGGVVFEVSMDQIYDTIRSGAIRYKFTPIQNDVMDLTPHGMKLKYGVDAADTLNIMWLMANKKYIDRKQANPGWGELAKKRPLPVFILVCILGFTLLLITVALVRRLRR